jgi:glycosyltransferase involved in cell wall biosynthesis
MRVLRVIGTMDPSSGGPCQGVRHSIAALSAMGWESEVVCLDRRLQDVADVARYPEDPFPIERLGEGRYGWGYSPALRPWLEKHLHRFNVVIVHGMWQYTGYLVHRLLMHDLAQKGAKLSLPYFLFPHGMLDPWFQRAPGRRLKAWRNWIYWKVIERHVVRNATALLFTCEQELRLARSTFRPYQPQRELNVGYGVAAPPPFLPAMARAFQECCPQLGNRPYILYLGRIDPKKGLDLLLRAYATVCERHSCLKEPRCPVLPALVVAGPGLNSKFGREMRELAARLFPSTDASTWNEPQALFTGMLSGDMKWGALYGCEAFVLPSHQENFGIAVAEALGSSKPVLISRQVNIWREISQEDAAFVGEDTLEGTIEVLEQWMRLPQEGRQSMTLNARHCFHRHFEIGRSASRLAEVLEQSLVGS